MVIDLWFGLSRRRHESANEIKLSAHVEHEAYHFSTLLIKVAFDFDQCRYWAQISLDGRIYTFWVQGVNKCNWQLMFEPAMLLVNWPNLEKEELDSSKVVHVCMNS
jgi:hypothetical protein